MNDTYSYYAIVDNEHPVHNPCGVIRRRVEDELPFDQAFTRNLRWEPSPQLLDIQHGRSYDDFEEITKEQADAFVKIISKKLRQQSSPPDKSGTSGNEIPYSVSRPAGA